MINDHEGGEVIGFRGAEGGGGLGGRRGRGIFKKISNAITSISLG